MGKKYLQIILIGFYVLWAELWGLESVRIQFLLIFGKNWKVSELESVRIGKCQNWEVSELGSVRIFRFFKYGANDVLVTIVILTMA